MREWHEEIKNRVEWIKGILQDAGAKGIVIGMSSGKDSNTVAALRSPHSFFEALRQR